MSDSPRTLQAERRALQQAMESDFEIMTVDIDKFQEEESDLVWHDELEDFWNHNRGLN